VSTEPNFSELAFNGIRLVNNEVMTKTGLLHIRQISGVVTITIGRPERKNAMNQAMWREIAHLFVSIPQDSSARVVILEGQGGDFCAGADISEFDTVRGNAQSARIYETENSAAFAAIRQCPFPTIAANATFESADYAEGRAAFSGKRLPAFKGR
jgi:1,4-dihydroxy-2-naphthoyl-CoA synthase